MKMSVLFLALALSAFAKAESMSCAVLVYKAGDLAAENVDESKIGAAIELPLKADKDGILEGEQEFTINGEKMIIQMYRKQYADVYDMKMILTTPVAQRHKGMNWVTILDEHIFNAGPAKDNGWTMNYKEGAKLFEYLRNPNGVVQITLKVKQALEAAGKWGKFPFTSVTMSAGHSMDLAEAVKELVEAGKLAKEDVVGIGTAFNCTLNK